MSIFGGLKRKVTSFFKDNTEVISAKQIQNGYFYTFDYTAGSMFNPKYKNNKDAYKYDALPVIFCIGPLEGSLNTFIGLNFNHLSVMKKPFFKAFAKKYNLIDKDIRHVLSLAEVLAVGGGMAQEGIRYYNRKNIRNPKRIKNFAVEKFIKNDGVFVMTDQNEEDSKFSIDVADKGV